MISYFGNFKEVTKLTSPLPITAAQVRAKARYFEDNRDDTSKDSEIEDDILQGVLNWERETGFLIFDQTFKVFLYNERYITTNFTASIPVLNVYSFDSIKYYPCDWNYQDPKTTLDQTLYYFTPEAGLSPSQFKPTKELQVFSVYNNIELNAKGGYQDNNFASMQLNIKKALILMVADAFDVKQGYCAMNTAEVRAIYEQYKANLISVTV